MNNPSALKKCLDELKGSELNKTQQDAITSMLDPACRQVHVCMELSSDTVAVVEYLGCCVLALISLQCSGEAGAEVRWVWVLTWISKDFETIPCSLPCL